MNIIERIAGLTVESEIADIARKRGLALPTDYVAFLLSTNGGRPAQSVFPIEGLQNNKHGNIQCFFGIGSTIRSLDLATVLEELPEQVPTSLFPIACTDMDDYLCIDTSKPGFPVVFWDRQSFWGTDQRSVRTFPVAPSFEQLTQSLQSAGA